MIGIDCRNCYVPKQILLLRNDCVNSSDLVNCVGHSGLILMLLKVQINHGTGSIILFKSNRSFFGHCEYFCVYLSTSTINVHSTTIVLSIPCYEHYNIKIYNFYFIIFVTEIFFDLDT